MVETVEDAEERVRVGEEMLKDVKLADDQGMLAKMKRGIQRIMTKTGKNNDMNIFQKLKIFIVLPHHKKEQFYGQILLLLYNFSIYVKAQI